MRIRACCSASALLSLTAALCTAAAQESLPAITPPADAVARAVEGTGWSRELRLTTEVVQQSALRDGDIVVARTADDRLYIRMPLSVAFQAQVPSARLRAFLKTLEGPLHLYPATTMVLSEAGNGPSAPQPRARAALRYLVTLGIDPGRLAIAIEEQAAAPPSQAGDAEPCLQMLLQGGGKP
jgi:hypothetical protein